MKNKLVRPLAEKVIVIVLFLPCFLAGFFVLAKKSLAENSVIISAIQISGQDANDDFIEFYNATCDDINLSDWKLKKHTKTGTESPLGTLKNTIPAKGYYLWENTSKNLSDNPDYSTKTYYLSTDYSVALFDTAESQVDSMTWGINSYNFTPTIFALNPDANYAIRRSKDNDISYENDYAPKNSSVIESAELALCPKDIPPEPKIYPKNIRINELFPDPLESPEKYFEYIELYNFDDAPLDLSGWALKNKNDQTALSGIMDARSYLSFDGKLTLHNDGDTITLLDPNGDEVSSISYEKEAVLAGYSYNFSAAGWKWSSILTAGKENEFDPPPPAPKEYPDKILLNEIFPYPSSGGEEFIELYNPAEKAVDLADWTLRDGSKNGKYIFPKDTLIDAQDYLAIYNKDFGFALNNSGAESVTLYSPAEKIVSTVSYAGAKKNVSYNFDGKNWHWSKFLTPEGENIFNNPPEAKTEVPKTAYKNMYAEFSAKGSDKDKDKLRYTWDFGDGHKSYLQKTRHKYTKTGKYTVKLKIFDGSEDKIETFKIEVLNYPNADVKIIRLSPNPKGKDSDLEWIMVRNDSKKKVDLNGWSIATGSKNLYNHPITEKLIIKPKKELKITRAFSKFTLNNKATKVELRYPNGKVASKVSYKSEKNIAEDAVYAKTGSAWRWQLPPTLAAENFVETVSPEIEIPPVEQTAQTEIDANIGKYSQSDYWQMKRANKIILLSYDSQIKTPPSLLEQQGRVLGASTENLPLKKHWAVKLWENIAKLINYLFNKLFLKFIS